MKPALLTLTFLLFAFPLAFSNDVEPVRDRDGNPVVPGSEYFGLTRLYGQPLPGKVTLGQTGNSTCPATVQVVYGLYPTFPLKFTPVGENATVILTDTHWKLSLTVAVLNLPGGRCLLTPISKKHTWVLVALKTMLANKLTVARSKFSSHPLIIGTTLRSLCQI